jgi:virulence factor Mce-like protein
MALFRQSGDPRQRGMSRTSAGVIALVVIAVFSYFGFTKTNPFADPYKFEAVFENADDLKPGSPVRIAGVDVGKVAAVEPLQGSASGGRATFEIKPQGLPLHVDATLRVRPRIFLEGNKFVDLRPGSPSAGILEDGGTVPVQQTSASVSFGDVLTALQSDTREDLQVFLKEYSKGLEGEGAKGFNDSIRYWESAYRNSSLANDATLGLQPTRDLRRVLRGQQKTFAALVQNEGALKDLVTNLNRTTAAFAREDVALEASIPELRDTLRVAQPALASLNRALPSVRAFAVDALPGVRSSDPTLARSLPFITQARRLFGRSELRGAARVLRAYIPSLVRLNNTTIPVLREGRAPCRRKGWLLSSGNSGWGMPALANGTSTCVVQAESARPSRSTGIVVLLSRTRLGM